MKYACEVSTCDMRSEIQQYLAGHPKVLNVAFSFALGYSYIQNTPIDPLAGSGGTQGP